MSFLNTDRRVQLLILCDDLGLVASQSPKISDLINLVFVSEVMKMNKMMKNSVKIGLKLLQMNE